MADIGRSIRLAVDTGKVKFGSRDAVKAALSGEAKLIILAENCPKAVKGDVEHYSGLSGVPLYRYGGTSMELGSLCGKPFPVSALSISEAGNSDILDMAKGAAPVKDDGEAGE